MHEKEVEETRPNFLLTSFSTKKLGMSESELHAQFIPGPNPLNSIPIPSPSYDFINPLPVKQVGWMLKAPPANPRVYIYRYYNICHG